MPVALVESSLFMNYITRPRVIRGYEWKCLLVISEFLLRLSDIDVKYLFNSIAIFSDFVMFLSSIINSSGSVCKDVFVVVINGS